MTEGTEHMPKAQRPRRTAAHVHYMRLTDDEDTALRAMAEHERRPLSHMLRECVRREAQRMGLWPSDDDGEEEERKCA